MSNMHFSTSIDLGALPHFSLQYFYHITTQSDNC